MNDAFNEIVDRLIISGLKEYEAITLIAEFVEEQINEMFVINMLSNNVDVYIN